MSEAYKNIWVLTEEPLTAEAVAAALGPCEDLPRPEMCRSLGELAARLGGAPASAAIVDVDAQGGSLFPDLERTIAQHHAPFILIGSHARSDLLLEAMRVGARRFIPKDSIGTELGVILQRLMANGSAKAAAPRGSLLTVLSAGGGCGATTLAVNLANELQLLGGQALVVDFDAAYGAVATYLGVDAAYGLGDVLADNRQIDAQLIRSTAASFSERLHVLVNPVSIEGWEASAPGYRQLGQMLQACNTAYRWTVADAPRLPIEVTADLARTSRKTLIVGQLSVKDIRAGRALGEALVQRGVPPQAIEHVANRYRWRGPMVRLDEATEALRGVEPTTIANDFRSAVASVNYGQPLAQCAPRSAMRREVQRLARRIADSEAPNHAGAPGAAGQPT